MKTAPIALIGVLALCLQAHSQGTNPANPANPPASEEKVEPGDREVRNGFWEANLPGGNYLVALGRISSVSRHRYALDGAVIVDEVTVDTSGQALARFYFISPISGGGGTGAAASAALDRAVDLVDGAARRAGTDVQDMVIKKYPVTTHSKSIEYRLMSEEQLGALYKSAKTAWMTGKGRVFTAR